MKTTGLVFGVLPLVAKLPWVNLKVGKAELGMFGEVFSLIVEVRGT